MLGVRVVRAAGVAMLAGADAVALAALHPHAALVHRLAAPHRWVTTVGADAAAAELAGAALWLAAAWLGIGLAASAGAVLPGALGRGARRAARATLPRAVYRLAAGAAGLGVLLSPAVAEAAPTSHGVVTPAPAWPTDDAVPSPSWPISAVTPAPSRHALPTPPSRTAPVRAAPVRAAPATRNASAVVVAPGDSLWRIAGAHLPARPSDRQVAAAWPRWYAANRAVIGTDPNHITPGQVLAAPAAPVQEDQP
jgi:hypothetical protein